MQKLIPQEFFPACIGFVPGGYVIVLEQMVALGVGVTGGRFLTCGMLGKLLLVGCVDGGDDNEEAEADLTSLAKSLHILWHKLLKKISGCRKSQDHGKGGLSLRGVAVITETAVTAKTVTKPPGLPHCAAFFKIFRTNGGQRAFQNCQHRQNYHESYPP